MTSPNLSLELIAIVIIATTMMIMAPLAVSATHLWTGHKWVRPNNTIYFCIHSSFSTTYKNAIMKAANDVTALPSSISLPSKNYDSKCTNHVYPSDLNPNYIAYAFVNYYSSGNIKSADVAVSTQYQFNAVGCTDSYPPPMNLVYTMHHEFSHWIEMKHPSVNGEYTVMNSYYKCNLWNNWGGHDTSTILSVYPPPQ